MKVHLLCNICCRLRQGLRLIPESKHTQREAWVAAHHRRRTAKAVAGEALCGCSGHSSCRANADSCGSWCNIKSCIAFASLRQ